MKVAVNLDDDALNLWLTALRHASTLQAPGTSLLQLFPLAISLLAENLDLLGKTISIVESYLFVDASLILQASLQSNVYMHHLCHAELCFGIYERRHEDGDWPGS